MKVAEGEDYKLIEDIVDKEPWYGIELLKDKYKGIQYRYNWVKVTPDDTDNMKVSFEYDIIKNPNEVIPTPEFEEYLGDILVSIVINTYEKVGKDNEHVTDLE